jgi:DNA repair protein SbcD/Mre11
MKYAHLSDLHIGSWRDERMRDVSMQVFLKAIDMCITHKVDFILFAGDLFNTALPAVDKLAVVAKKLCELKDRNVPVYVIPGSHDFSPSGKTMIDVLENSGVLVNVCKGDIVGKKCRLHFTIDKKTGAKITGIQGKKGMLDRLLYEDIDRDMLESEKGYKIFMFHTTLAELKPKHLERMDSVPAASLLPHGFDYYAGGHVHHKMEFSGDGYKKVTQPGALFPNNFAELEKYSHGGFYIVETKNRGDTNEDIVTWHPVEVKKHVPFVIECEGKRAEEIHSETIARLDTRHVDNALVTLRFRGVLSQDGIADIRFKDILAHAYYRGAYFVMKNTAALKREDEDVVMIQSESIEDIETAVIEKQFAQNGVMNEKERNSRQEEKLLTKKLMGVLATEKKEGETTRDFEARVKSNAQTVLNV